VTCRPTREGGLFLGPEAERLRPLASAAELGAEYVDVEWDAAGELGRLPGSTTVVVSRHLREGSGTDLDEAFASLAAVPGAAIQKLAVPVADARDALALLERAARERRPTIAVGLGPRGVATRLLAGLAGAPFTYAAADPGRPATPGQPPLFVMGGLLARRRVTRGTRALGVLGNPLAHSRSPVVMNGCFATLAIDAVYTWLETDDPGAVLRHVRADPAWVGLSVTAPHKGRVATLCDRLEPTTRAIGAVNTVLRRGDGTLEGTNTDAPAAVAALASSGLGLAGLPIDLLGAGGAARACAHALKEAGARVTLYNRTEARGREVARALGVAFGGAPAAARATGSPRAVVNATSASPVSREAFDEKTVAFDLVYVPAETPFLALARERGAATVSGVEHFAHQAWLQLEQWFGPDVAGRISSEWIAMRAREVQP
jgi:3-dehydroquinate dehydratase/shikimate dehydrogenase